MANALDTRYEPVDWSRPALLSGTSRGKMPWARMHWWWIAPLVLLPFLAIATWWAVDHIEGDVVQASRQILDDNGIDTENLSFEADYRDVRVDGVLPAGTDRAEVERLLEDELGSNEDGDIRDATITATVAAPAALGAIDVDVTSDGSSITLTGTVPSQAEKDSLRAAAEATGLVVNDALTVSGLEASSADASGQIGRLNSVVGGLTAGAFTSAALSLGDAGAVTGSIEATSAEAAAAFEAAATDIQVTAPPELGSLDTAIDYDGTRIVLNGTVLSAEQSSMLEAAAVGVVGAGNVVNNLQISDLDEAVAGADDRIGALSTVIATFGGLTRADATMNDTDLTVNGDALDDGGREATLGAVSSADAAGLRPGGELTVIEPPEPEISLQEEIDLLQNELDSLQEEIRENVVFATDSDVLSPEAQATLDKVVAAMERHPRPVVEVGGHTDSQGDDAYNEALSQRRADSVVAYLTESISADRLRPVGFGESQPVADNNVEAGRLQNRRVELIAKESF